MPTDPNRGAAPSDGADLDSLDRVGDQPDWGAAPRCDEAARIARLRAYGILDTPAEEVFDRITRWARRRFSVPVALVSLVDVHRQWFKSVDGLAVRETPRDVAFCDHAVRGSRPLVVPDARLDPRFRENPLVLGDPGIRFYAGAPILTPDRFALGTVCLIDSVPREFPLADQVVLSRLAAVAAAELEARRTGPDPREPNAG